MKTSRRRRALSTVVAGLFLSTIFVSKALGELPPGVAPSAEKISPLKAGDSIPDVKLTTPEGKPFDLAAYAATKPLIVIFYRGGW